MSLTTESALSDLWFAYANFNHEHTGRDLRNTASDFLDALTEINAVIPSYIDEEWLVAEYQDRA
jgi:hypothetical protein